MDSTRNPDAIEPYDPDDISNYGIDWRDWLEEGQTLTDESWTIAPSAGAPSLIPRGLFTDRRTSVTLMGGGVPGTTYTLTCQATKSNGERKTTSFRVTCREA